MRNIEEIIDDWKAECGIQKTGKSGFYRVIPFEGKKDLLLSLAQTMIDEGYGQEDLSSRNTRDAVVTACSAPDAAKIKNNHKIKKITAEQWKLVLLEFFRGSVSKYVPADRTNKYVIESPKEDTKLSKPVEIEPTDRIKIDISSAPTTEFDTDFLNEFGVDPSFFEGGK